MAINKKTSSEFATQIADGINDRNDTLDTTVGPIKDLFIDPVSDVLENQNDRAIYLNRLLSLNNASTLVPDDVDGVVANESIVRISGSSAVTTLTFSRTTAPTVNLTVPVNFPISTVIDPSTGSSVSFRTVETKTMYSASASAYYNVDTELYELDVLVASISTGQLVRTGANTIISFLRPLSGFEAITNKAATTGGRGTETNAELATRYFLHVDGAQLSTPSGIKRFILDNISGITDVYIVYGSNTYLTREQDDAGAVDVWFIGSTSATRSYITYYRGTALTQVVDFQPVISVSTVISGATTYVEGTDYSVITGVGEYAYSSYGSDGIQWIPGGSHPAIDAVVTITYTYNSMANILASFFTQGDYYCMGSDRLFRWAQSTSIAIEANLTVSSGSPSQVQALVREAVFSYINSLTLGQNVEEFDIDTIVARIYGVDNWTYNNLQLKSTTPIANSVADLEISPNTYAVLAQSDFIINLV